MLHRPSKGDGIFLRQMKGHIRSLPVECMGYCRDNQVTRLLCKAQGEKKADGQMLVAMGREGQTGISYREPSQLSAVRTGPAVVRFQDRSLSITWAGNGDVWRVRGSALVMLLGVQAKASHGKHWPGSRKAQWWTVSHISCM